MKNNVVVTQVDPKSKTVMARYHSMKKAAEMTGVQPAHIGKVVNGIRNTAGGFIWRESTSVKRPFGSDHHRVYVYDDDSNLIATFRDIGIMQETTAFSNKQIQDMRESGKLVIGS